jgi:hypothetical protein
MRHATSLLYHLCAVASRNIRFASCGTSGKLTLWTRLLSSLTVEQTISSSKYYHLSFPNVFKRVPIRDIRSIRGIRYGSVCMSAVTDPDILVNCRLPVETDDIRHLRVKFKAAPNSACLLCGVFEVLHERPLQLECKIYCFTLGHNLCWLVIRIVCIGLLTSLQV